MSFLEIFTIIDFCGFLNTLVTNLIYQPSASPMIIAEFPMTVVCQVKQCSLMLGNTHEFCISAQQPTILNLWGVILCLTRKEAMWFADSLTARNNTGHLACPKVFSGFRSSVIGIETTVPGMPGRLWHWTPVERPPHLRSVYLWH